MSKDLFEYYTMISNSVNLKDVRLKSLKVDRLGGKNTTADISLGRAAESIEDGVMIVLKVNIFFEESGPFEIELEIEGLCVATEGDISADDLKQYSYDQVVPLLLPYARETVASTLARMHLPIFNIPTIDVLRSMEENSEYGQE